MSNSIMSRSDHLLLLSSTRVVHCGARGSDEGAPGSTIVELGDIA